MNHVHVHFVPFWGVGFISGSRGGAAGEHPSYSTRLFRFYILLFRNIAASDLGASPWGRRPPPSGNPGSATGYYTKASYWSSCISRHDATIRKTRLNGTTYGPFRSVQLKCQTVRYCRYLQELNNNSNILFHNLVTT